MLVLTAFIHVIVYGALTAELTHFGGRIFLFVIAVPVLALHLSVWACARFLPMAWAIVAAFVANAAWSGAGWVLWFVRRGEVAMPPDQAAGRAVLFLAVGLATSALLIAWVRFVARRRAVA